MKKFKEVLIQFSVTFLVFAPVMGIAHMMY